VSASGRLEFAGGNLPVTEHASQVIEIMQPVIEAILRGQADPAVALPEANQRVNALFEP
jgi:hypothetical protein